MGKGIKRPVKVDKPDFKKKKLKVGRKLTKQANETKIDVRVAKLSLPTRQADDGSAEGQETPGLGKASMHEALRKLGHHNCKVRKAALQSLASVLQRSLDSVTSHLGEIFESSIACLLDADQEVRKAFLSFWRDCVQQHVAKDVISPFLPLVMAHIRSASSHLNLALRLDALTLLRILIAHSPQAVVQGHTASLMQLFVDALSQKHRERSLAARAFTATAESVSTLEEALTHLSDRSHLDLLNQDVMMFIPDEASVSHKLPALNCARGVLEVPGVISTTLNTDENVAAAQTSASWLAEADPNLYQDLFTRLRSCWNDCGPSQAIAAVDASKLACMASILNCMCMLYAFVASASGSEHPFKEDAADFVVNKVLEVFPAHSTPGFGLKQSEPIRRLNARAARLLSELLDFMLKSTRLISVIEDRDGKLTSHVFTADASSAQQLNSHGGVPTLQQVSVTSSQAFAAWASDHQDCSQSSPAVCGITSAATGPSDAGAAGPDRIHSSMLKYCRLVLKGSKASPRATEVLDEPAASAVQLHEVLTTAKRLLELLHKEHRLVLLQDMTDLMAASMPMTKLRTCAAHVLDLCVHSAESHDSTPVSQPMLKAWVTGLCATYLAGNTTDCNTLELLLQSVLHLCRMACPHTDHTDALLEHALSVASMEPGSDAHQAVQVLAAQICSYKRPTEALCCQLCHVLETGKLCRQNQVVIKNALKAALEY